MSFRLYDSMQSRVVDFVPLVPGQVSIYHCGLTVQAAPHLGHIRKEIVFDVLRRWLTRCGYHVRIVANVTDIDDKILATSKARGVEWFEHAYHFERELHHAYDALGCLPPSYEPRATGHIPEMLELIQTLIDRGHAYAAPDGSGDVYFDVRSWPDYGKLSHQNIDDMAPAEDADPRGKRDPHDFALWKGYKEGEPRTASWPSPWGRGRPGWHIECSAMSGKYLGPAFDIHGGGIDLRFPHHENELAQSTAAGRPFAHYWMHNAWVTAAGEKMSKSLSNGALVSEVTKQYPPRAVRLYLAAPHYRSKVEFSDTSLAESTAQLARIDNFLDRCRDGVGRQFPEELVPDPAGADLPAEFAAALDDDLGTPQAFAVVFQRVRDGNQALDAGNAHPALAAYRNVKDILSVLGLDPDDPVWTGQSTAQVEDLHPVVEALVADALARRADARARKDWQEADAIRDTLVAAGVKIEDTAHGARWSLGA